MARHSIFTAGLGLATGFLFGLFPATQAVRTSLVTGLTPSPAGLRVARRLARSRVAGRDPDRARHGAAGAVRSLHREPRQHRARRPGHRREGLVTFRLAPSLNGYTPERSLAFFDRIEDDLRALAGVTSATSSTHPLLADSNSTSNVTVEGFQATPDTDTDVMLRAGQLRLFPHRSGCDLLAGREFTRSDAAGRRRWPSSTRLSSGSSISVTRCAGGSPGAGRGQ